MINKLIKQIGPDKVLHFLTGAVIMALFNFWLVLIVAIGKEVNDQIEYKGFSKLDIIYTLFGGLVAFVIQLTKECIANNYY